MEVRVRHVMPFAVALLGTLGASLATAQADLTPEAVLLLPPDQQMALCQQYAGVPEVDAACAAAFPPPPPPVAPTLEPILPAPASPDPFFLAAPLPEAPLSAAPAPAAPAAPSAPAPPPDPRWRMRGEVDVGFVDLGRVRLDGDLALERVHLGGVPVGPREARLAHRNGALAGAPDPLPALEEGATAALLGDLAASGARPEGMALRVDREGLLQTDDLDAPLRARLSGDLVPDTAPDARKLAAALRAGARVALDLPLQAAPGADVTYRLRAPDGLAIAEASVGDLAPEGRGLALRLDNAEGETPLSETVRLVLHAPDAAPPRAEDVRAHLDVALGAFGPSGVPVTLDAALEVHALDVAARFPGALPAEVTLPFVDAHGLRALHAADALAEADLAAAEAAILDGMRAGLAASLPGAAVSGGLARDDLREDAPPGAPLRFHARTLGAVAVDAETMRQTDLALALGATLALDVPLPPAPVPRATYALYAPPGMTLVGGAAEGTLAPEGGTARLLLRRSDVPDVRARDAEATVRVDMRGVEVDSGRILSGGDPRMAMDVDATLVLRAVEIPAEIRAALDPRVDLTHLAADGLRRLRHEGLLTDADLARMQARLVEGAAAALQGALGAEVQVTGGFVEATLAPGAQGPVLFALHATARPRVDAGTPDARAALALHSAARTFVLPRLEGLDTEYALVLPPGIEVGDVRAEGGAMALQRVGGRDVLVLRPEAETMTASAVVTLTPGYVLARHGAEVFAVLLTLVLLVEAPVAFLLLRRGTVRKRETARASQAR